MLIHEQYIFPDKVGNRPHVMFVITGLRMGGAETQCLLLVRNLIKIGYRISVTVMESGGMLVDEFTSSGATVYELDITGTISLLKGFQKFRNILRKSKPQVVHSHMIHANYFTRLVRLIYPIPKLICTAHNIKEGSNTIMMIYRYTDFLSDSNTNVSKEALQSYLQKKYFSSKKSIFVPNAIDTKRFSFDEGSRERIRKELNLNSGTYIYLAVGRLHEQKDYPNLLRAFSEVINLTKSDSHLLIVGDGEMIDDINDLIKELKISNQVSLLGTRTDVNDIMNAADCFVLSSAYEGFGLVVAEALSCQLPVVATDCGGVREVLGSFGTLVHPRDFLGLASAMMKMQHKGQVRNSRGRSHIIKKYDIDNVIGEWLQLYGPTIDDF